MDLSIKLEDTKVKIRVAGLVKTKKGYLFEKSDNDYIFTMGGKIMLNESSREAMIRETEEEIGFKIETLHLRSVIENFYGLSPNKVHEICFVYEVEDVYEGNIPEGFIEVSINDVDQYDIRPKQIVEVMKSEKGSFTSYVVK